MDTNVTADNGESAFDACQEYYAAVYADVHVVMWGGALSLVSYGIILSLFVGSLYWLKKNWISPRQRDTKTIVLMIYLFVMFSLSTITAISVVEAISKSFAFDPCLPGEYLEEDDSSDLEPLYAIDGGIIGISGAFCSVISNFLADCLLAWRCFMMFKGSRLFKIAAVVPILLMLTSAVLGMLTMCLSTVFIFFYYSVTLAANLTFTLMIVCRLIIFRGRIRRVMGNKHGSQYTNIMTMIIESEGLTVAVELWLLIALITGAAMQIPYLFLVQAQVIAPLLLIFRVAQGKAWSNRVIEELTNSGGPIFAKSPRTPGTFESHDLKSTPFQLVAEQREPMMNNEIR